jgi:hypothetical protein
MGDIDLLVRREQFPQVMGALLELGWRPQEKDDSHLLPMVLQGERPGARPDWGMVFCE